ncbi:DUF2911 domain-containing protein [Pedobacter gandavensis]|uniref:DUF2911 domain-containing protein n=1 Tax=Pedobacter gandavensis TaxID=2679963 RepID=A0ABR6EY92_9SPHI|nr:DUF2911 domain-containing protein [Pedobacter gandavensis]MBB2150205.1 DUF2911 domain-containing protein [Pedobacter gandavensis]
MKRIGFIAMLALYATFSQAQEYKLPALDPSPADILYYPLNVAKAKDDASPVVKVVYSRPGKKGRDIFGVLEQFGKVWRLGANEATEIKFFKNVVIDGKKIKKGSYSLFAIPEKDKWTMILNKQTDRWGAYTYNEAQDVLRIEVPVKLMEKPIETLSMTFVPQPEGANLVVAWDKTAVELPIIFK